MATSELTAIRRETARLRESLGTSDHALTVSLVPIDPDGSVGDPVDIHGQPCDSGAVEFVIPAKILECLTSGRRYSVVSGGRGAAKSHGIARYLLAVAITEPARILCLRSVENTLRHSVHELFSKIIAGNEHLRGFFDVGASYVVGANGSEFRYEGLTDYNAVNVKSAEGFTLAWITEGQAFRRKALEHLIYTIREDDSRILIDLNPQDETDPVYQEFVLAPSDDPAIARAHVTYEENPFCPEVLRQEAERLKHRDRERYEHVFMGQLRQASESRIFKNVRITPIDIESVISQRKSLVKVGYAFPSERERRAARARALRKVERSFFIGLDFGYVDPTAATICYLDDKARAVYVVKELWKERAEIEELPGLLRSFDERIAQGWTVSCDNSRPEIISYLRRHDVHAEPCVKLQLIDRIDDLSGYDIFVDPVCENTAREFQLYSWDEDRNGNVIAKPRDAFNHSIDSVFYALGRAIKQSASCGYRRLSETL